ALSLVPQLASLYDEPFADASQIPTLLVTRMARQHVTVALSGDGGDELFCGYSRYFRAQQWLSRRERIPLRLRPWVAAAFRLFAAGEPRHHVKEQLGRLASRLGAKNQGEFYHSFVSYWPDAMGLLGDTACPA